MERFSSDRGHHVVAAPLVDHGLDVVLNLRSIPTTLYFRDCSKKLDRFSKKDDENGLDFWNTVCIKVRLWKLTPYRTAGGRRSIRWRRWCSVC